MGRGADDQQQTQAPHAPIWYATSRLPKPVMVVRPLKLNAMTVLRDSRDPPPCSGDAI
jgi:hypothetical protein